MLTKTTEPVRSIPKLSPYIAKVLLYDGTKAAYEAHSLLGGKDKPKAKKSASLELGLVVDKLVLGPAEDIKIRQPREKLDLKYNEVSCTPNTFKKAQAIAEACKGKLPEDGIIQYKLEWNHGAVKCKGYIDQVTILEPTVHAECWDLKSIYDFCLQGMTWAIEAYGYDIAQAAYAEGLIATNVADKVDSKFLFVSTQADENGKYQAEPYSLTWEQRDAGNAKWLKACQIWGECLSVYERTGYWLNQPPCLVRPLPWRTDDPNDFADLRGNHFTEGTE